MDKLYHWDIFFSDSGVMSMSMSYNLLYTKEGEYTEEECLRLDNIFYGIELPHFDKDPVRATLQLKELSNKIKRHLLH